MQSIPRSAQKNRIASLPWPDIIAGLSLAGLLLPEAVAYSSIANLPPQAGIIALFAGLLCYGVIGSSRFAIVSATSSSAVVLAAASSSISSADLAQRVAIATGLVVATGLLFTLAGMARLGSISAFIAKPVLRGFAFGLAIVIILGQIANVVGVHPQHGDVIRFSMELLRQAHTWNWNAGWLALAALALLFVLARVPYLPGSLLLIVLGITAGKYIDFAPYGIKLVGSIQFQLTAPTLPALSYSKWLHIGQLGFAMLMIVYAESYGSIRGYAMKHGDTVAPNRDLIALGLANICSGLLHGMPVGAGYSATSANEAAGARSRLAGWCACGALLLIVICLLPAIALTPEPLLAAVVVHAVSHTLHPAVFRPYFMWRRDRLVIFTAVLAVLLMGVLDGLLAAVGVSLLMLLLRLAESSVTQLGRLDHGHDFVSITLHREAKMVEGMVILRPDSGLFFANVERILAQARSAIAAADTAAGSSMHTIIVSLEESPDLDSSSVEALSEFCAAMLGQGKHVLFARLKPAALQVLERAAIAGLGPAALCALSVDDAVALAQR